MAKPHFALINGIKLDVSKQPTDFSPLAVTEVELEDKNIKVVKLNGSYPNYFIYVGGENGNTLLDFAGAEDFRVFFYDEVGELKGRHWALNNHNGFMIQTRYKRILLVKYKMDTD